MNKPTRIQLRRTKNWRKPPGTIVVSRPSRWGNPYTVKVWGRALSVDLFKRDMILALAGLAEGKHVEQFRWMTYHLHEIRDADHVACFCKLTDSCHGDVLIELANRRRT